MTRTVTGDLFTSGAEALVNPVNTVGVMGGGLAWAFKSRFPVMEREYRKQCRRGELTVGTMHVWRNSDPNGSPRWIINFPTKADWRDPSRIEYITSGLSDLVRVIREHQVSSVAIPALGCGLGGLEWAAVEPLIQQAFEVETVDVLLFAPASD